jgi:hypothetical protein
MLPSSWSHRSRQAGVGPGELDLVALDFDADGGAGQTTAVREVRSKRRRYSDSSILQAEAEVQQLRQADDAVPPRASTADRASSEGGALSLPIWVGKSPNPPTQPYPAPDTPLDIAAREPQPRRDGRAPLLQRRGVAVRLHLLRDRGLTTPPPGERRQPRIERGGALWCPPGPACPPPDPDQRAALTALSSGIARLRCISRSATSASSFPADASSDPAMPAGVDSPGAGGPRFGAS